jgi:hypothetical protein
MRPRKQLEYVFNLPVESGVVAVNILVKFCGFYTVSMKVETGYVCWNLYQSEM